MVNYRRCRIAGGCFFFTVALTNRRTSLLTRHICILREAFRSVMNAHPFFIDAIVVLPDHLHCILSLPQNDDDYSMRWRQVKSAFSRQLPTQEHRSRSRIQKNERGIWQRRFWEHAIRNEQDYIHHINYIHYNPVKHGYVQCVADWEFSSFHRFVARGVYPVDWGGGGVEDLEVGERP